MNSTQRLADALLKQAQKPQGDARFLARMGDSSGTISTGVAGYVYVRLYNGEVMEVFNNRVPNVPGWVMVGVDPLMPGLLQVLGPRDVFPEMSSSGNVGEHHETHELFKGHDVTWINSQQIMEKLAKPSDVTGEEFFIQIYEGNITTPTGFIEVAYQKVDISASQPTSGALMVLLQVDNAGVVSSKDGTPVASKDLLTLSDVPLPDADHYPIWAVEVYDGQDNLRCDAELNDFHDLRFGGFAISGGAGYDLAATIHAASASAITASDEFGFWEDTSGLLKKITWANVQATLETYFDTQYQPLDATLTSLSALGTAADKMAYTTGVDTWAETGLTAFARSILDDADEATFKATVNLEIGTDVQAYDATLAALAALADGAGVLTNDGVGGLSWAAAGGGVPVADTTAVVMGSADNSKLLRFEVDGFTTATTRVITPPNADITLAGQNYANTFTQANTFNDVIYANNSTPAMKAMLGGLPSLPTLYVGLWLGQTTPGNTNFTLLSDGATSIINAPGGGGISFRVSNVDLFLLNSAGFTLYTTKFLYLGNSNQHYIYPGASDLYLSYSANWYIRKAGADIGVIDTNKRWGMGTISPATKLHLIEDTTTTNAVKEVLRIEAQVSTASTGSANGFGVSQTFYGETATNGTNQIMGRIATVYIDSTNATRKSALFGSAYDTAEREGWRVEASGTEAKLSFYGGTTVVRGAALTTQLTTITHTAPGTPDYAVQDFVDVALGAGWAFASHDEANSVLAVIANLQTRAAELEARLGSATGVNLFA